MEWQNFSKLLLTKQMARNILAILMANSSVVSLYLVLVKKNLEIYVHHSPSLPKFSPSNISPIWYQIYSTVMVMRCSISMVMGLYEIYPIVMVTLQGTFHH